MGVSLGTNRHRHDRDVEINVVPFIDLLSCLVAYLIVTAVWVELSQLEIEPRGVSKDGTIDEILEVSPSVLMTESSLYVGTKLGITQIDPIDGRHDWPALERELLELRAQLADATMLEVAAEDAVVYQQVISAMDVAVAAGWPRVSYVDPASASIKIVE